MLYLYYMKMLYLYYMKMLYLYYMKMSLITVYVNSLNPAPRD